MDVTNIDQLDLAEYFAGGRLWGDNFDIEQIEEWYRDEQQAYFALEAIDKNPQFYDYHALNWRHGYSRLPTSLRFSKAMSFGGANGEELRPAVQRIQHAVIVEPAEYSSRAIESCTLEYRKPNASGVLPASNDEFDLLTSLGALHHVPNVSTVVTEFYRVLKPGSFALVRDPVVSMGDWRKPRYRLTKRERGIPLEIFDKLVVAAGFRIVHRRLCVHALTPRIGRVLATNWFNSRPITWLDDLLSNATRSSPRYHPTKWWQKLQPSAVFYLLQKPA